jgi:hypothetical protein
MVVMVCKDPLFQVLLVLEEVEEAPEVLVSRLALLDM